MIKKISFFLILFLILFTMLSWSLNALGIIDINSTLMNIANSTPLLKDYIIIQKELEALEEKNSELNSELQSKEEKITELEIQLEESKEELAEANNLISNLKTDYELLDTEKQDREQRLEKIASIYKRMEAPAAAGVIQELNRDLVVEVLSRLDDKKAAAILAAMPQQQAAQFISQLGLE